MKTSDNKPETPGRGVVVVAGKRLVEVDLPTTIFASYFAFMDEPDCTVEDKADFLEALREYTKGNFDFVSPNKSIRGELRQIRIALKQRRQKYLEKYEQRIEAAKRGGQKTKEKLGKMQDAENQVNPGANALPNARANARAEIEIEIETETKNPPNPPAPAVGFAVLGRGGAGFSFSNFFKAVKAADAIIPAEIDEAAGRYQVLWRYAEFGARYSNEFGKILFQTNGETRKSRISELNAKPAYKPQTDFLAVKLAAELINMAKPEVTAVMCQHIDGHMNEPGIFATMRSKLAYLRSNSVGNLKGFIEARKA